MEATNTTQAAAECDVLIIGAGMTGSCLARQLKLQFPDLRVMNIDRRSSFSYWIGESTVEAWEDYMVRVLGLGDFLEKNFPRKHGLRMFFDSPEKNLPLPEMSEFGRSTWHDIHARHLDRTRFDQLMCDENRALGIDVRLGVSVAPRSGIHIDREEGHRVETSAGTIRCRWLIDAAGRSSPLAATLELVPKETTHRSASYWARFRNTRKLDELGPEVWRGRVNHTTRQASTNHFLYEGYWIWHIALSSDVVSIGVEFNRAEGNLPVQSAEQLVAFLKSHRCLADILEPAELVDFSGYAEMPRCASRFFSTDRWFLAGMSGFFADVMGSGTSRVYSEVNRLIGELIRVDLAGDEERFRRRADYFSAYVRASFKNFQRSLSPYQWYGSFDLFSNYFGAGLAIYFNNQLPNCKRDLKCVIAAADSSELRGIPEVEEMLLMKQKDGLRYATWRLAGEYYQLVKEKGSYHAGNRGRYADSLMWEDRPDITEKISGPRDMAAEKAADLRTYREYYRRLLERLCEIEGVRFDEAAFESHFAPMWTSEQPLKEMLGVMRMASEQPLKEKVGVMQVAHA